MIVHEGFIGAFNFAIGPAVIYESKKALDLIQQTGDPFVVIVPDTIPLKELFSIDIRHVRGFVLKGGEKDDLFTTFVITQRRAAVRCVSGILDGLVNGDTVAVDGVLGKVFVKPDPKTCAYYEARRVEPAPEIKREHLPRLAIEAMRSAKVPDMGATPALPQIPDMLNHAAWPSAGGPSVMPKDAPTPLEIKAKIEAGIDVLLRNLELARLTVWQSLALAKITMFMDRDLEPDEIDIVKRTVADEFGRLESLKEAAAAPPPEIEEPEVRGRRGRRDRSTITVEANEVSEVSGPEAADAPAVAKAREKDETEESAEPEAPRSAAEQRRAQREAEIAAARAARSGEAPEPEKAPPASAPETTEHTSEAPEAAKDASEVATDAPAPEPEPARAPDAPAVVDESDAIVAAALAEAARAKEIAAPEGTDAAAAETTEESDGPEGAEEGAAPEGSAAPEDAPPPDADAQPKRRPPRRRPKRPPPPPKG